MFSTSTRLKLESIIGRIEKGEEVSFQERVYVDDLADSDPTVSSWLKKARRLQQKTEPASDGIEELLNDLALGPCDPDSSHLDKDGDLGEWFTGAPSWLARS